MDEKIKTYTQYRIISDDYTPLAVDCTTLASFSLKSLDTSLCGDDNIDPIYKQNHKPIPFPDNGTILCDYVKTFSISFQNKDQGK